MGTSGAIMRMTPFLTIMLSGFVTIAAAQERLTQVRMQRLLRSRMESVQELAATESVIRAVRGQNERAVPLDRIKEIDAEWVRAKVLNPFRRSLQENEVGRYFNLPLIRRVDSGILSTNS